MKRALFLVLACLVGASLTSAVETWNDVTVIDGLCLTKFKDNPDKHTTQCALQCVRPDHRGRDLPEVRCRGEREDCGGAENHEEGRPSPGYRHRREGRRDDQGSVDLDQVTTGGMEAAPSPHGPRIRKGDRRWLDPWLYRLLSWTA